ncbi:MAG: hypothetical protein ACRD24_13030 [Terriglobales bacterium]
MPYDEFDAEDPLELVGCEVPLDDEQLSEMAECFVEEFARMGLGPDQILALFASPFYRGPHSVYQGRGEAYVRDLIAGMTGRRPSLSGLHADLVTIQAEVKE